MNLFHLHPTLKVALKEGKTRINTILNHWESAINQNDELNIFERNTLSGQNAYQRALVTEHFGDIATAYAAAKSAFRHDTQYYYQHPDLVRIALAHNTEESRALAFEIADHFAVGIHQPFPPFWESWDIEAQETAVDGLPEDYDTNATIIQAMDTLITAAIPLHPALKAYFYHKESVIYLFTIKDGMQSIETELSENDTQMIQTILAEWRASGLNQDSYQRIQSWFYYGSGQKEALLNFWQGRDMELAQQAYPTAYWMTWVERILAGEKLPENLIPPSSQVADMVYNAATCVLNIHDDLEVNPNIDPQLLRLGIVIGEQALKLYEAVEQGELNGYANDAHVYAMLCRNLGCLHRHAGNLERHLDLAERGMALSPFIENGHATVYGAYEIGQYDRTLANIAKLRRVLDDNYHMSATIRRKIGRYELGSYGKLNRPDGYVAAYEGYLKREAKHLEMMTLYCTHTIEKIDDFLPTDFTEELESFNDFLSDVNNQVSELLTQHPERPELLAIQLENCALVADADNVKRVESLTKQIKIALSHRNLNPQTRFLITFNQGYLQACKAVKQSRLNPLRKRNLQQAITQMEEALTNALRNNNPVWRQRLGFTHFLFAHLLDHFDIDSTTAIKHYSKAIDLLPDNGIPLLDLFAAWTLETDSDDLKTIRYRYVKGKNDSSQLQISSAANPDWIPLNIDEYQESVTEVDDSLHPNYLRAAAYFQRGVLLQDHGKNREALNDFHQVWRLNPFYEYISFAIATVLSEIGGKSSQAELDYHSQRQ